ncbi:radical SAM protein [candidate division WOR-3 bacterium]|nr:radical SAM protein [candidate division WOR-3 bacterium]
MTNKFYPLKTIYMYLMGSCNLKCRHCWIDPDFVDVPQKYLTWTEIKRIYQEAKIIGLSSVKLTGGEPFLHPEILQIITGIKELGLGLTIETNGTLLDDERVHALKKHANFVAISIDGAEPNSHEDLRGVEGSFDAVLKGAGLLKKEGLGFQVIFSLYRKNLRDLFLMPSFVEGIGGASLKVNPINVVARSEKMERDGELFSVEEILEIKNDFDRISKKSKLTITFDVPAAFHSLEHISKQGFGTCGILTILGILSDGTASICGIGSVKKELDFGNCLDRGIENIWRENDTLNMLRENIPHNLQGVCMRCVHKHYCLGKCVAETYARTGSFLSGYYFCQIAQEKGLFPPTRLL